MPCEDYGDAASTMLDVKPIEFRVDQYGWDCKLAFEGDFKKGGKYLLWINEVLASALPKAPPIQKDDIPAVCQSDNLVILNDIIKRVTF